MKSKLLLGSVAALSCLAFGQLSAQDLSNQTNKISYAMGAQMGQAFAKQKLEINPSVFSQALSAAYAGKKLQMTDKEVRDTLTAFQQSMIQKQQHKLQQSGSTNMEAATAFLEKNKSADGVKTTSNGLQYKVLTEGDGAKPSKTDTVTVDYEGKLINGTVFDSSYKRGKPASFPVGGVIPGWTEALQLMKTGATWELFIPPKLAYGAQGIPGAIGPNELLIFKVHLISIDKK